MRYDLLSLFHRWRNFPKFSPLTLGVGDGQGRPRMLQSMGLQRVGHNWVTELNWINSGIRIWIYAHMNPLLCFSSLKCPWIAHIFFADSSKLDLKCVCLQPRQGTAQGAFLLPLQGEQCPLSWSLWAPFFYSFFFFFKLWKYENTFTGNLENTEQSYI